MGKQASGGTELCNNILIAALTSTNATPATGLSATAMFYGYFNLWVYGTFVGTVELDKSFDAGTTWVPASLDTNGDPASYTGPTAVTGFEIEPGIIYRFNCTAYTSGTIQCRLSQTLNSSLPNFRTS